MSFLAGYFEIVFLTILTITIHELGHFFTGIILKLKVNEIRIYMFGGVTNLNEELNLNIKKEILTLIMGPITQVIFLLFICFLNNLGYVSLATYNKLYNINMFLLKFNLLPILPLDGGKLVNNILDIILSYKMSHLMSVIIGLIFIPILFTFDNKLFIIISCIFLVEKNIEELLTNKYKVNKLILERKLHKYKYRRQKEIKNIYKIKRNENFIIEVNNLKLNEADYFKYNLN